MQIDPPNTPTSFERIGGEPGTRALVDRFYDLMDLDPAAKELRALHPTTLDGSRDKLFWFLCGWLGGPQHNTDRFGHPMLRARHLPFAIGIKERDQPACSRRWANCKSSPHSRNAWPSRSSAQRTGCGTRAGLDAAAALKPTWFRFGWRCKCPRRCR